MARWKGAFGRLVRTDRFRSIFISLIHALLMTDSSLAQNVYSGLNFFEWISENVDKIIVIKSARE